MLPLLFLLALVQAAALPGIAVAHARPDLLLLVVIATAFYAPRKDVLWGAFIAGMFKDLFSIGNCGTFAVLFTAVAFLVREVREILFREHPVTQFGTAFLASFALESATALAFRTTAGAG